MSEVVPRAAESFARLFARRRHLFALGIGLLTLFFAWQMTHLRIETRFLDLLPRGHPFIQTYEAYDDVYGNANAVLLAVVAREGSIYDPAVLEAVHTATEGVDSSIVAPEVNAHPASAYVSAEGPIAVAVQAVVRLVDRVFRSGAAAPADTGVDHNLVASLTHFTVRDQRVLPDGTLVAPQMVERVPHTPEALEALRVRVRRSPTTFGVLVSPDESAALVRAAYVETHIDYAALFKHLRALEADIEARFPVDVHVAGQPMLFGWAYAFATEILLVFALTGIVSGVLLWAYFRRVYGVFLPLSGAAANVVWGLGFAGWTGIHLDPLVLVVPMLITARAVSHSVQFVERFYEEYEALGDKDEACIRSMAELLLPGGLAIGTDCLGLLVISLATIPLIHQLGLLSAFWAASILVTEMLLNRLLILYLPAPRVREHHVSPLAARLLGAAARVLASRRGAATVVGVFALLVICSAWLARGVTVGESRPGSPILYADSEFNLAAREIGRRFTGLDDLLLVAHGRQPGRVLAPDSLRYLEALQGVLGSAAEAGGSISLVDLLKQTNRTFHNNDPRWAMVPQTGTEVLGLSFLMETSVPLPGILDPYRAPDGRSLAVRVFYRDHRAETIDAAMARLREFLGREELDGTLAIRLRAPEPRGLRAVLPWLGRVLPEREPRLEVSVPAAGGGRRLLDVGRGPLAAPDPGSPDALAHWTGGNGVAAELRRGEAGHELWVRHSGGEFQRQPSGAWLEDGVELRLAAGTIGVLAASNQEIDRSHTFGLVVALAATFLLLVLSYRSLLVGFLLLGSLATAALVALATQALLGIGINVNTLPVQAIGIGIGVDYAIYIVDRIVQERRGGLEPARAIDRAVRTTGLAIAFTASTLVAGVLFWIPISSLRFSAEMAGLLSVLMVVNALGAILLVPSVLRLVPERWLARL